MLAFSFYAQASDVMEFLLVERSEHLEGY